MSQEQLGRAAFISGDMIAKVERGDRSPSAKLVEACEQVAGLGSNGVLTVLWEGLRVSRPSFPGWFAPWPDLESQAVRLKAFELTVIPGLLQTEGYASALLTGRIGFNGDVEEAVSARLARQAILERDEPPEMFAVIDEAALHRPVGSPGVMADQLGRLADSAARVIVRIIPASTGVHDGLQGAFTVADFADGSAAAYLESGLRGQVIQDGGDVAELTATWDRVAAETLPRSASLRLIQEVADAWNS
jgi:transcriptional regulator with XRE-family HTH domain